MLRPLLAVLLGSTFVIGAVVGPGAVSPAVAAAGADVPAPPGILINELSNGDADSDSDSFFELRNWGTEPVDLTGWQVFRCSAQGLRSNWGRRESDLTGIVLAPGGIVTISRAGMPGDGHITQPFASDGFGLYLADPASQLVDAVGVYPNEPWPTQSECTVGRNLPNSLNFAASESWQRVSATGDVATDWLKAPATLGEPNAVSAEPRESSAVVISEVASAGPSAADDEFVELLNTGTEPSDISGWQLYRCTASGRLTPATRELTVASGTTLAPGARFVIGGGHFTGTPDARLTHSLADVTFGVLLQTDAGRLVDRLAIASHADSACQEGDSKLPAVLDAVANQSYQRSGQRWLVAPRTPGAANATVAGPAVGGAFSYTTGQVAISEVATDPTPEGMPAGTEQRNYIELGNYGTTVADIGGWTVRRCEADGTRSRDVQFTVPEGTRLAPGSVYLAAREGTAAASHADITYATSLNFLGTGLWVSDADGQRVDSVGIYAANELDASNVTASPCTKGAALTTYQPDRLRQETFQRTRFTGVDRDDFVTWEATPGVLDLRDWVDPTERVVTSSTAALPAARRAFGTHQLAVDTDVVPIEAYTGVTFDGPLTTLVGDGETSTDATAPADAADSGYGYPYQRFVLDATTLAVGSTVGWRGTTVDRGELQLSVWSGTAWRLLASGSGELTGSLEAGDIIDGRVTLLVQDGQRGTPSVTTARDGQLENPADYDLAITHITDTQYLTESYPEVYAQLASWIADNAADRKIAFATHTGDLIQNWVDPDQNADRARVEFERASAIQSILDDAGLPNSVLPGNHDSKRGVDYSLFNEYFPPSRYEATDWYGGSIAPGDNTANFSTFESEGAKFLMLSLPYAYGDHELDWAEQVVTSHPDFNVIVSTHEHVMPKTLEVGALHSTNSRWVSRGQDLWDRVIAPNRNVIVVLSGHFHGIGQLVTEDAGGLPGHTVVELLADYQEFRTHTGERATGFYRMLQLDLDGGAIAVDTRSVRLAASYSYEYDYRQFLPDNGLATTPSNARPWRILDEGVQGRYSEADDEFTAYVEFQHPKLVSTDALLVGAP